MIPLAEESLETAFWTIALFQSKIFFLRLSLWGFLWDVMVFEIWD